MSAKPTTVPVKPATKSSELYIVLSLLGTLLPTAIASDNPIVVYSLSICCTAATVAFLVFRTLLKYRAAGRIQFVSDSIAEQGTMILAAVETFLRDLPEEQREALQKSGIDYNWLAERVQRLDEIFAPPE